jgi:hypothetical protein
MTALLNGDEQNRLAAMGAGLVQMSRLVKLSHPKIFADEFSPDYSGDKLGCSWTRCRLSWNSLKNTDATIDICFEASFYNDFLTSVSRSSSGIVVLCFNRLQCFIHVSWPRNTAS